MKLVVGLGNPGGQYAGTRHNVGFEVVAELARRWQADPPQRKFQSEVRSALWHEQRVLLVAPQTFMNASGEAIQPLVSFWKIPPEDMCIVCDDMDLPLGLLRWRAGGSSGGQKGLASILGRLGTEKIPRLRLGVGRPEGARDSSSWVLSRFPAQESESAVRMIQRAADSVESWISRGLPDTMNQFNRTDPAS
jgi:PTH1 family peptidyl-tRNA hydrolase